MPLSDLVSAALALDQSILDVDQVENLIKFCPTKVEMELLKNYTGDKETLGKCEQCAITTRTLQTTLVMFGVYRSICSCASTPNHSSPLTSV
ncbi:formin-like protein 5 isoform X2 [Panicum virgatum]|uniref:formin-like protein 5 isoform X2 n=1 Tax=Panicum virgatum TaxID=38727 RepID=UPI0019D5BE49|nr:formin-like protein 5 isoform X2 [Panicum virgatum]